MNFLYRILLLTLVLACFAYIDYRIKARKGLQSDCTSNSPSASSSVASTYAHQR